MIKLGPAGSGGLGNEEGLKRVKEAGLNAMEIEFTYGVKMSKSRALEIGKIAKELDIALSVHAPYYINLASKEESKIEDSKERIFKSSEIAYYMGASYVVFHGGFYQKRPEEDIYKIIRKEVKEIVETLKKNKWNVFPALETTGKRSQFGSLDELLKLREETGCEICVDFSHLLAREGKVDYKKVFDKLKHIKHIHAHFSGIEYGEKGERRHILTKKKDIIPLIREIVKQNKDITIINESPDPLKDSISTKNILDSFLNKN